MSVKVIQYKSCSACKLCPVFRSTLREKYHVDQSILKGQYTCPVFMTLRDKPTCSLEYSKYSKYITNQNGMTRVHRGIKCPISNVIKASSKMSVMNMTCQQKHRYLLNHLQNRMCMVHGSSFQLQKQNQPSSDLFLSIHVIQGKNII